MGRGEDPGEEARDAATETSARVEPSEQATLAEETVASGVNDLSPGAGYGRLGRGDALGRYLILDVLGSGGMGTVYTAHDPKLDRKVAVKVLQQARSHTAAERMVREARALARLNHPNVVAVHDVGEAGGEIFIAMEFVDGKTLGDWGAEVEPWQQRLAHCMDAGRGLAAAHAEGLVHRDFKPGNVMVGRDARTRVLDFGLVSDVADAGLSAIADADANDADPELSDSLTREGAVLGTPTYMSPEQHLGLPTEASADQFSFCVTTWELLFRERPFAGRSLSELALAVTSGDIESPAGEREIPASVRQALRRGLSTKPSDRWPSMEALLEALEPRARLMWPWLALGGVAAAGLVAWGRPTAAPDPCQGLEAPVQQVWNQTSKRKVAESFDATGLPVASQTATQVSASLDRWREGWIGERRGVCEATRVKGTRSEAMLDRKNLCLDRTLDEVRAAVDLLTQADAQLVSEAEDLVAASGDWLPCRDGLALMEQVPPPPEEDRAAVYDLWATVRNARSQLLAGRVEPSAALLAGIVEPVQASNYAPLQADFFLVRGRVRDETGEFAESAADLERAAAFATRGKDDRVLHDALVALAMVTGVRQRKLEEGLRWSGLAEATTARFEVGPSTQALLWSTRGRMFRVNAKFDEAIAAFDTALDLVNKAEPPSAREASTIEFNRALALNGKGETKLAKESFERVLEIEREAYGEHHARVATTRGLIGVTLRKIGELEASATHLRESLRDLEASLGPAHSQVGLALLNLGNLQVQRGELEPALESFGKAVAIQAQAHHARHPLVADAENAAAIALKRLGRLEEADAHYKIALDIWQSALGPEHSDVGIALVNMAMLSSARELHEQARTRFLESHRIFIAAHGPDHPYVGAALEGLAQTEAALEQWDSAIVHATDALEALRRRQSKGNASAKSVALGALNLAEILNAAKREPKRVRALAAEAKALLIAMETPNPDALARVKALGG